MSVASLRETEIAILNAPLRDRGWERALESIAQTTRSSGAHLLGIGGPLLIPLNVFVGNFAGYEPYFSNADLHGRSNWRVGSTAEPMAIQVEADYDAYRRKHDTADYDDAVSDLDIPFGCQSAMLIDSGRMVGVALLRSRRDGPCDADTLEAFRRFRYQASRAARMQLALANEAATLMLGNLETVACATLLLDRSAMICALTAVAEQALDDGPFRVSNNRFGLRDPVADHHLQRAFARLLAGDGYNDALLHQVRIDGERWDVTVARLPSHPHGLGFEPALAVTLRPISPTARCAAGQRGKMHDSLR